MRIIEPGHVYKLDPPYPEKMGAPEQRLTFVNREAGTEHGGTQTQEVLRALIDRTIHCDNCLRWEGNDKIIYHLRMALVLHEARTLERKVEKGLLKPEYIKVGEDGHFLLERDEQAKQFEPQAAHPLEYFQQ